MEFSIRRELFSAWVLSPVLALGSGCADSESMMFIRQAQARVAGQCTVDNSPSSVSLLGGSLDLAFQVQYSAALLVGNQLVPRGNSAQLRTETARVEIQGSIVHVEDASGAVVWGPVTVPGTGFVDPASGADPSFGVISTILLGSELGSSLSTTLMMERGAVRHFTSVARVFGRSLGGMAIESGDWRFPISVCWGCKVTYPPEATDPKVVPIPNCALPATTGGSVAHPCIVGQDDTVDCRVCKETFPHAALCDP